MIINFGVKGYSSRHNRALGPGGLLFLEDGLGGVSSSLYAHRAPYGGM